MTAIYHVSTSGCDGASGEEHHPFRTIGRAACAAQPGDTVVVHEGVYRERVDPPRGGLSESERIVYRAAEGEGRPVIKGSERVCSWERIDSHPGVWKAVLGNAMFHGFNPFERIIAGDWLERPKAGVDADRHLGDVYLNGRSLYEVSSLEDTYDPPRRDTVVDDATTLECPVEDPGRTRLVWFADVDQTAGMTTIWANFHDADPNVESVEVSVRQSCFFPSRHHVDFITVRGFEMAQASGDWAPPTSPQCGMVGPNWAYGWIIEDNVLHDAKFSAVSLGKEDSSGNNEWSRTERKTGYQYQLEAVFKARRIGWRKGMVGSHIVRRNDIHNCGQNAIVGHMGCAFSRIEHNHIHHIGDKREFFGWEVAGIKFHAAIDTVIVDNYIHDCSLGMWMDWQAQGTRITGNILRGNVRDLMVEVSHGPYLVDNNVFASPVMMQNWSQGGAFVHNLICGSIDPHTVPDRSTPYHYPHSTEVAGCAVVSGGDERWVGNVFAPQEPRPVLGGFGLGEYSWCPSSMAQYLERQHAMWLDPGQGGGERNPLQPVYAGGNVFLRGAMGANGGHRVICDRAVGEPAGKGADVPGGGGNAVSVGAMATDALRAADGEEIADALVVSDPMGIARTFGSVGMVGADAAVGADGPIGVDDSDGRPHDRTLPDLPFFGGIEAADRSVDQCMTVRLVEDGDGVTLECDVPDEVIDVAVPIVSSGTLGVPRIVEERYERPDGGRIVLNEDMVGVSAQGKRRIPGPLCVLSAGRQRIRVWRPNHA